MNGTLKHANAGVLSVGYVEAARPTAPQSCCCTGGRTTCTASLM